MHSLFFLLVHFLAPANSFATTANVASIILNADSALNSGDTLHAYRLYSLLELAKPKLFYKSALEGYLQSIFLLGTSDFVEQECSRFIKISDKLVASKAAYICGLEATEQNKFTAASNLLIRIDLTSPFYWPAQILLGTNDLMKEQPSEALKRLSVSDISHFKKSRVENVFHITRARALFALNNYDLSLREYQTVSPNSRNYVDALREMSFIFYKQKKFLSAQVLIDVLKTNYEDAIRVSRRLEVSSQIYFEARFLEAYLLLDQSKMELAAQAFDILKSDLENFAAEKFRGSESKEIIRQVKMNGGIWADKRDYSDLIKAQLQISSDWLTPESSLTLKRSLVLYSSYAHEAIHLRSLGTMGKSESEINTYSSDVEKLKVSVLDSLEANIASDMKRLIQSIHGLSLKSRLGKLEVASIVRAQGTRSLDEVIDDYSSKLNQMNELAPP